MARRVVHIKTGAAAFQDWRHREAGIDHLLFAAPAATSLFEGLP